MDKKVIKILVIVSIIMGIFYINDNKKDSSVYTFSEEIEKIDTSHYENIHTDENLILVSISGEIMIPDMYLLKKGTKLESLIEIAGGFTSSADKSNIDFNYTLKDKQNIVIPKIEIDKIIGIENKDELININTSDQETLKKIPYVGDTIADNIIKYREKFGNFKDISGLKNVDRIGNKLFEKIKNFITI